LTAAIIDPFFSPWPNKDLQRFSAGWNAACMCQRQKSGLLEKSQPGPGGQKHENLQTQHQPHGNSDEHNQL
jgi:hypothetical protein